MAGRVSFFLAFSLGLFTFSVWGFLGVGYTLCAIFDLFDDCLKMFDDFLIIFGDFNFFIILTSFWHQFGIILSILDDFSKKSKKSISPGPIDAEFYADSESDIHFYDLCFFSLFCFVFLYLGVGG